MPAPSATVHASAVLAGARAVLIRGPSASGKSRLALELLEAARIGALRFARLVADDRVHLRTVAGRLLASAPDALAGLIEVRGVGLMRVAYEPQAVVGLVVDLDAPDAERMPTKEKRRVDIDGISLPRLPIAKDLQALPSLLALLKFDPT